MNLISKNKYAFVQCIDDNFVGNLMCITSCKSIQLNLKNVDLYILCLSTNPFISYYKSLGINIITCDEYYNNVVNNLNSHEWSKFVYIRFLIFKLDIFKQYNMTIYIDCDTFITSTFKQNDLINLDNNITHIGMIPERMASYIFHVNRIIYACNKNNITLPNLQKYYNAGVILLKPSILNDTIYNKLIDLMQYSSDFLSNDQDIINIVFANDITPIGIEYNLFNDTYIDSDWHNKNIIPSDENIKIWHYAGIPSFDKKVKRMITRFYTLSQEFLTLTPLLNYKT